TAYVLETGSRTAGEWVTMPGLGDALEMFAAAGADLFHGALGELLVDTVRKRGGVITIDDLRSQKALWDDLATADIAGTTVSTTPGPTHAPSLLAALAAADGSSHPDDLVPAVIAAARARRREAGDIDGDGGTSVVTAA